MEDRLISLKAAIDTVENCEPGEELFVIKSLPSAQPEITEEDVKEYCKKRCLIVVTSEFYDEMIKRWSSAQPEIIYCHECIHYNAGFECLKEGYGIERDENYFCGSAERRTDG